MEKLEIMIKLASDRNVDQVLMELKEYATEVDVEFVRRSVRAIGRCAIKLEKAAERCINVLLELIQTKVNYVVQEAVIVIKDIFRKFPNRYPLLSPGAALSLLLKLPGHDPVAGTNRSSARSAKTSTPSTSLRRRHL